MVNKRFWNPHTGEATGTRTANHPTLNQDDIMLSHACPGPLGIIMTIDELSLMAVLTGFLIFQLSSHRWGKATTLTYYESAGWINLAASLSLVPDATPST